MHKNWEEVNFKSEFAFQVPIGLSKVPVQAIDTDVALWQGDGISVRIDYGLFADRLDSYRTRASYRLVDGEIDGISARIVSFDQENGSHVVAAHFPNLTNKKSGERSKLTILAEANADVGRDIPSQIIQSIRFRKEEKNES